MQVQIDGQAKPESNIAQQNELEVRSVPERTSTTQPADRRAAAGVPSLTNMSVSGTPSTSTSKPLSTAAMCAAL
jgi:hypothetical protein